MKPTNYFFSRKNLILASCIVLGVYVAIWAGVLVSQEIRHRQEKHEAALKLQQFNSQSAEQKAIIKAENYLKTSLGIVKTEQRLALDYLQRKFDLDSSFNAQTNPFQIAENPRTYPQEINFLARMSYPDKIVTVPPRNAIDGPVLTNIYSANCDHMSLPSNFWSTMHQNFTAGSYYLTHTALALVFIKDNSCQIPPDISELESKVTEGMTKLAADSSTNPDLRYEAIAFLGLTGQANRIERNWIEKIVAEQKDDGSWVDNHTAETQDHATTLALWALLEYSKPNVPYEPLIHHPAKLP